MKIKLWFVIFLLSCVSICYAYDYEWIEPLPVQDSWINWTTYTVYSSLNCTTDENFPSFYWLRDKKIRLMNNLYNATLHLTVKDNSTFAKILDTNSKVLLWDLINNSPNFSMIKTSTNSTIMSMGIKIIGDFLENTIPMSFLLKMGNISQVNETVQDFLKGYTGVIIQIDTPRFKPGLMIWIYSQNGEILFSPQIIDYETFVDKGIALYLKLYKKELIESRVGPRPLVVNANAIYKDNVHSIVLDADNSFYFRFKSILALLKRGKLVVMKKQYTNYQEDNVNEFKIQN